MNRDALGPVFVAVLAALALGVGAASIDSTTTGGDAGNGGPNAGPGQGSVFDLGRPTSLDTSVGSTIPKIVFQLLGGAIILAFLASLYAVRDELGLQHLGIVAALSVVLGVLLAVLYLLLGRSRGGQPGEGGLFGERAPTLPGGGSGSALDRTTRTVTADPPLFAIALAVVLLIGAVLVFRSVDNDSETESTRKTSPIAAASVGRVAGRAANRIAGESTVENEVYRAWHEMTTHLDVERPASFTPGEFARAASQAGMARRDVEELTDLFRTVRYGGGNVTENREARAVAALRRIEREYAEAS